MNGLARIEALLDEPDLAVAIGALEAALPIGVRPRQLSVRTLLVGMLGTLAEGHQNAHLSSVHAVLVGLGEEDQERLSVRVEWKGGAHTLTYRQVEYTIHVLERALSKDTPEGAPSPRLQAFCDRLLEASIPLVYKDATGAYAIDWTDAESFSRPPSEADGPCADPEAHFGHRRGDGPGQRKVRIRNFRVSSCALGGIRTPNFLFRRHSGLNAVLTGERPGRVRTESQN